MQDPWWPIGLIAGEADGAPKEMPCEGRAPLCSLYRPPPTTLDTVCLDTPCAHRRSQETFSRRQGPRPVHGVAQFEASPPLRSRVTDPEIQAEALPLIR